MAKYAPLATYLRRQRRTEVVLTFRDIERIISGLFPKAAATEGWWKPAWRGSGCGVMVARRPTRQPGAGGDGHGGSQHDGDQRDGLAHRPLLALRWRDASLCAGPCLARRMTERRSRQGEPGDERLV